MIYLILSLIIGFSAAIFVWAIFVLEKDLSPNTLKRLDRIKHKTNVIKDYSAEKVDLVMHNTEYRLAASEKILKKYKFTQQIKNLIFLSDTKMQIDTFIFVSLLAFIPFLIFLFTPFKLMFLFGFVAMYVPTLILKTILSKRYENFSKQFPDALNLMASSLRAGHPLFSAINFVTDEMPEPICSVFATTKKDISLGIDTKEAFLSMTKTMPESIDLRFFITAVLIQKEIGGNLAELLDSLSGTIRERFKLIGQLKVQTAQTKISGVVLGLVPIFVILIIFFMSPDYIRPLFDTKDGQTAFVIAIVLIIAGFASIKKISTIEM